MGPRHRDEGLVSPELGKLAELDESGSTPPPVLRPAQVLGKPPMSEVVVAAGGLGGDMTWGVAVPDDGEGMTWCAVAAGV